MKRFSRFLALFLCVAMLLPCFAGCSISWGGGSDEDEDPYKENYLLSKAQISEKGGYTRDWDITMGGHSYTAGFTLKGAKTAGSYYGTVTFALDGMYDTVNYISGSTVNQFAAYDSWGVLVVFADDQPIVEQVLHNADLPERHSISVKGVQKLRFEIVDGTEDIEIGIAELTCWTGEEEPVETGHHPGTAPSEPVKLIRDLPPYYASSTSVRYYPNDERETVKMSGVEYRDIMVTGLTMLLIGTDEKRIFFNAEGLYSHLTFTAGGVDVRGDAHITSAYLQVIGDGKILFEELISYGSLPERFRVDVTGVKRLEFVWTAGEDISTEYSYYGISDAYLATSAEALDHIDHTTGSATANGMAKLVSEIGPFAVHSGAQDAVYDGTYQYRTFSMGSKKYNEGVILMPTNWLMDGAESAVASFNLQGRYQTLRFTVGHVTASDVYKDETLRVYGDGVLLKEVTAYALKLPQSYTVEINNCNELKFEIVADDSLSRPAFGLVEMAVYTADASVDLFPKEERDYPDVADLIADFGAYDISRSDTDNDGRSKQYYDGSTKQHYFKAGGRQIDKGFILKTHVYLGLDDKLGGAAALGWLFINMVLAGSEIHESSFAAFNLEGQYRTVKFTVGRVDGSTAGVAEETTLLIGADHEIVEEITLRRDMEPTTYEVDIENCDQLLFWLNCSPEDSSSYKYAFYDITVSKTGTEQDYVQSDRHQSTPGRK